MLLGLVTDAEQGVMSFLDWASLDNDDDDDTANGAGNKLHRCFGRKPMSALAVAEEALVSMVNGFICVELVLLECVTCS